jgi:methionyl-tRNA formyltransferase
MENPSNFNFKRLILFGGNRKNEDGPLFKLAIYASKLIDEVIVFTDPLHWSLETQNGKPFGQMLEERKPKNLDWVITEKIDTYMLKDHLHENTLGLLLNASWIIKKDVINLFRGNLFNYHNTRLPQERGAAAYSWKILTQCKEGALTIHKVVPKLDAGDIVKHKKFLFPETCRISADYYKHIEKIEFSFLRDFIKGKEISCVQQNEADSIYMPKLDTILNGFINWEWSAKDIELFIRAFDDPHQGASTFVIDKRLHLKKCSLTTEGKNFHPFQAGIIYRKNNGKLFVAAKGGGLEIREVFDENGENVLSDIKIGQRLQTPYLFLDQSKTKKFK